jgi:hypothetical protein
MTDATRLLQGLREYSAALQRHLAFLHEQSELLRAAWIPTRDVYRGHGADVFAEAFDRATTMVETYTRVAEAIQPILRDRIESLERFDSPNHPSV